MYGSWGGSVKLLGVIGYCFGWLKYGIVIGMIIVMLGLGCFLWWVYGDCVGNFIVILGRIMVEWSNKCFLFNLFLILVGYDFFYCFVNFFWLVVKKFWCFLGFVGSNGGNLF